ncbi:MAG: drug/metabolite transporter (DMT)-like permease [Desulforhopalus sp.]|jgi:drug/metabolite transporter (DMT)-like permease
MLSEHSPSPFYLQLFGWLAVFGSTFCFYMATVIIRWSEAEVIIEPAYFVFARFLLGFIVVSTTMLVQKQRFQPKNYHYLLGRTIANTVAVFCFYKAVSAGTVSQANILNMTYPLFVTLFSWVFFKNQRDIFSVVVVIVAFVGVWLVLSPGEIAGGMANVWGLFSGVTAAAAIIYLNVSRRCHDSQTILFVLFALGAVLIYCFFYEVIFWPDKKEFGYLLACSVAGVAGQYLLTYGFLFVTAVEGSIISSSRILLAALLGPLIAGDPPLAIIGWCGALLIFTANAVLAIRKA